MDIPPVVLDNGSGSTIKAGYGGELAPKHVFPAIVGRTKPAASITATATDFFVAQEALSRRGILTIKHPIEHGVITNWDDVEQLWRHAFHNLLCIDPKDHPLLLTECSMNPSANREKTAEVLFETFQVPSLCLADQAVLSLHASGLVTGVVLDTSAFAIHAVPIYYGHTLAHAVARPRIAGSDALYQLNQLLSHRGITFPSSSGRETVRDIFENLCYVAEDYAREEALSAAIERHYTLPDGRSISLAAERFRAPEVLFRPELPAALATSPAAAAADVSSAGGASWMVADAIARCDADLHAALYAGVVLAGGPSLLPGFPARVRADLAAAGGPRVQVAAPANRLDSAWVGGAMRAAAPAALAAGSVSRGEYEEVGPRAVRRKCP